MHAGPDAFSVELLATAQDPEEAGRLVNRFVTDLGCHYGRQARVRHRQPIDGYVKYKYNSRDHIIG